MSFFTLNNRADATKNWREYTLVLPAVCVGNVGQLSVDILIATTQAERVGHIYDESLLPMIGNDPYSANDCRSTCKICTCCDVYCADAAKLVIIQQRALFVKGKRKSFREKLVQWIKEQSFARVILLSASFAHARTDKQITGNQYRYLAATPPLKKELSSKTSWVEMEEGTDELDRTDLQIPGSGIAKTLYSQCCDENVPLVVLLKFCSEGDNGPDALKLVNFANDFIGAIHKQPRESLNELNEAWKIPRSWNLNFGNRLDNVIFG